MPDEDYEGFVGSLCAGVECLEGVGVAVDVEDGEVCDALDVCCGRLLSRYDHVAVADAIRI